MFIDNFIRLSKFKLSLNIELIQQRCTHRNIYMPAGINLISNYNTDKNLKFQINRLIQYAFFNDSKSKLNNKLV